MCFYFAPLRLFHRATNPAQELFSCFQHAFNLPSRVFLEKKKKKGDNNPRTYTHIRIKINSQLYNFSHASFTLSIVSIN